MNYITYDNFCKILKEAIDSGEDFYLTFLKKIIANPENYCGYFQCISTKAKVAQGIAQSYNIRFGNFLEEITTKYLDKFNCRNLDKNLKLDKKELKCDQLFIFKNKTYLVEQKIRDNHDSSKKTGQFGNFEQKIQALLKKYAPNKIVCGMWFIDDCFKKNKNKYENLIASAREKYKCEIKLWYGKEFFSFLKQDKAWDEYITNLQTYKDNNVEMPDFGKDERILNALTNLSTQKWNRLLSNEPYYKSLREELFKPGDNLEKAKEIRLAKNKNTKSKNTNKEVETNGVHQ